MPGQERLKVLAILETMWDWRVETSSAGYTKEAPRFFKINPKNHSGRRLYKLVGPEAKLLVTNACRELVKSANHHGKPDPVWLYDNLRLIDGDQKGPIDVLLVCGKIAQATYQKCGYRPKKARVLEIAHPAARTWTKDQIEQTMQLIQNPDVLARAEAEVASWPAWKRAVQATDPGPS